MDSDCLVFGLQSTIEREFMTEFFYTLFIRYLFIRIRVPLHTGTERLGQTCDVQINSNSLLLPYFPSSP